jgi:beta-aspartyl-peptidase (threonine type)
MRVLLAKRVIDGLADGREPSRAAHDGIDHMGRRVGGHGGIVVVDPLGRLGHASNTPHMTVGFMQSALSVPVIHA